MRCTHQQIVLKVQFMSWRKHYGLTGYLFGFVFSDISWYFLRNSPQTCCKREIVSTLVVYILSNRFILLALQVVWKMGARLYSQRFLFFFHSMASFVWHKATSFWHNLIGYNRSPFPLLSKTTFFNQEPPEKNCCLSKYHHHDQN